MVYTIPGGILRESCPVPLVIRPPPPLPQPDANSFTNLYNTRAFNLDFPFFSVYVLSSHWQWRTLTGDPLSNYKRSVSSEIAGSAKLGPFSRSRAHIFACSSLRRHPYYLRAWKRLHKLTSFRMVSPTRYPKKSVKLTGWPFDFFCRIMLTCLYIQDGVKSSHIQLSFTFSRSSSLTFLGWIFGHSGCE